MVRYSVVILSSEIKSSACASYWWSPCDHEGRHLRAHVVGSEFSRQEGVILSFFWKNFGSWQQCIRSYESKLYEIVGNSGYRPVLNFNAFYVVCTVHCVTNVTVKSN